MKSQLRGLLVATAFVGTLCGAYAATSMVAVSGPTPSSGIGTITVVDATPSAPWYQRSEILGLLGPVVTLTVGLFAAFMAFQQIDKQRRNTLDLQTENKRNEFKLEIYREFSRKLDPTEDGLSSVSMYVVGAANEADSAAFMASKGIYPAPLKSDGKTFNDKFAEAGIHVAEVIMLIERYLVVEPALDVFRLALNSAMHDVRGVHAEIMGIMFKWFPVRRAAGSISGPEIVNVKVLPRDVIDDLGKKGWEFYNSMSSVTSYLDDLRRELQIHLLSGLFDGEVPVRKPLDPKQKVVTLDKTTLDALRKHFLEETAWGQHRAALEKEVGDSFKEAEPAAKPQGAES